MRPPAKRAGGHAAPEEHPRDPRHRELGVRDFRSPTRRAVGASHLPAGGGVYTWGHIYRPLGVELVPGDL